MLRRKGSRWELYPYKVKYIQHNKEIEQWALPRKEWWVDFAVKWEHTKIVEFTEIELTESQLARYEEIKYMPENFMDMFVDYILTGNTPSDVELPSNHPFNVIKLRKENGDLRSRVESAEDVILDIIFGGM